MRAVIAVFCLFLSSAIGTANAEITYDMKSAGNQIKQHRQPSEYLDPIEISALSNDQLTFSGDTVLNWDHPFDYVPSNCCSLHLGNLGSFTVRFDQPVNSVGIDIFPLDLDPNSAIEQLFISTVSAVYKNNEGEIVGQSSVTADWLGEIYGSDWRWNNSFNGHESAFGVTTVEGFTEITFTVDGDEAYFMGKGTSFLAPLNLASTKLYYTYANPIPEPETYALMLAGLGMLGITAKHRRKGRDQDTMK